MSNRFVFGYMQPLILSKCLVRFAVITCWDWLWIQLIPKTFDCNCCIVYHFCRLLSFKPSGHKYHNTPIPLLTYLTITHISTMSKSQYLFFSYSLHIITTSIHSIWCPIYMLLLRIQFVHSDCLSFYMNAVSFILILLLFCLIAYTVFLFCLLCCITSLKAWYFILLNNSIQFDFIYMAPLTIDIPESRKLKISPRHGRRQLV